MGHPAPLNIFIGTGDSDNYAYDSNTGRMTNYTFTVGSAPKSQVGNLTWNQNGTLRTLAVTDGFNSGGTQTCNFGTSSVAGYDDLGRLLTANCGSVWAQTFSYDQYDNITKSGSSSWMPGYDSATNHALGITYDSDGNVTNDTFHRYGWYVDNKLGSTDSTTCTIFGSTDGTCVLYDAFGREVERGVNGVYSEVMYTPAGKTAIMNGQTTTVSAYFPLPGGATYLQTGSTNGSGYFWHKDWLGSVRLSSSVLSRTFYFDRAFAPYGEMYNNFGNTAGLNFTGDTQDSFTGLYDTPNRELHPSQGRWLSPDPAGAGLNLYAYGTNPNSEIDPAGLTMCCGTGGGQQVVRVYQSCGVQDAYGHCLGPSGNCTVDGIEQNCQGVAAESVVLCPNNDCSAFGRYTGMGYTATNPNGAPYDFQLVAGVNGPVWINNFNGEEASPFSVASEFGLLLPLSSSSSSLSILPPPSALTPGPVTATISAYHPPVAQKPTMSDIIGACQMATLLRMAGGSGSASPILDQYPASQQGTQNTNRDVPYNPVGQAQGAAAGNAAAYLGTLNECIAGALKYR